MLESARRIIKIHPDAYFVISKAPHLPDTLYEKHVKDFEAPYTAVRNEEGSFYSYLAASDLAPRHGRLLASTAGVHPHDAKHVEPGWLEQIETLLHRDSVKAVGETGLDFNRNFPP